jgi:hypothetical protein
MTALRTRGPGSIQALKRTLRELPASLATAVAGRATPEMTRLARTAFDSNQSVYDDPRPLSKVTGNPLDLYRTGSLVAGLYFKNEGRRMRCVLGPRYAKYMIGLYGVLPNGPLPVRWARRLDGIVEHAKVQP